MFRMPVLFVGHGSPMNALRTMITQEHGKRLLRVPKPKAIVSVSAHWYPSTKIMNGENQERFMICMVSTKSYMKLPIIPWF